MDIAVVRRNGLGDLLCTYPLILYLQKNLYDASITLFLDARNAPLLPFLPAVDRVVVFPSSGNKYWNVYKTSLSYRHRFDLAISAKTSPMRLMNLFLYWLHARERVAYVQPTWDARYINCPIPYCPIEAGQTHQALRSLRLVAPEMGSVPEELYPTLSIPAELLKAFPRPSPSRHPIVLLTATTTHVSNQLDPCTYVSLLNELHQQSPIHVQIIGQHREDLPRAQAMAAGLSMSHSVYFPRSFAEFMVLLDAADLFFVGDGGIAHIGAALGKKMIVLFGETDPKIWHPLSKQAVVLYHPHHVNQLSKQEIWQALQSVR